MLEDADLEPRRRDLRRVASHQRRPELHRGEAVHRGEPVSQTRSTERMVELMRERTQGNPTEPGIDLGPARAPRSPGSSCTRRSRRAFAAARGCPRWDRASGRGRVLPAHRSRPRSVPGMPAYDEETFGPVAAAIIGARTKPTPSGSRTTVPSGSGAAVFTKDRARGEHIAAEELEAGACFVNTSVRSDPRLPFGGIKESGYGRELGQLRHPGIRERQVGLRRLIRLNGIGYSIGDPRALRRRRLGHRPGRPLSPSWARTAPARPRSSRSDARRDHARGRDARAARSGPASATCRRKPPSASTAPCSIARMEAHRHLLDMREELDALTRSWPGGPRGPAAGVAARPRGRAPAPPRAPRRARARARGAPRLSAARVRARGPGPAAGRVLGGWRMRAALAALLAHRSHASSSSTSRRTTSTCPRWNGSRTTSRTSTAGSWSSRTTACSSTVSPPRCCELDQEVLTRVPRCRFTALSRGAGAAAASGSRRRTSSSSRRPRSSSASPSASARRRRRPRRRRASGSRSSG